MTDAGDSVSVDALIREARMHQRALIEHRAKASEHQAARDRVIHQLRAANPARWTYAAIAEAVGLKPENVVYILRKPRPNVT
jgi:hypothetical protein